MIGFLFICIGTVIIVYCIKDRNKNLRDKILTSWFTTTAKVTNFEERIETDSDGDKYTNYIAHAEYYIDNIPYHLEENISKTDMYNINYIGIYYNPNDPTEYISEKGFNSLIMSTKKSIRNYIHQEKLPNYNNSFSSKPDNSPMNNIITAVFLIPFILVPTIVIIFSLKSVFKNNAEYEYVSKNWISTTATVTDIDEYSTYDDDGYEDIDYCANAEYIVNGETYICRSKVDSNNIETIQVYYNPTDASQCSTVTKKMLMGSYILPTLIFCGFWLLVVTLVIVKLPNPLRLIYLAIMYGSIILSLIYTIFINQYTFIP